MTGARSAIVPVILCGGAGTRLWPLSRREAPKQFQRLTGDTTLFQDTLARFPGPAFATALVLANKAQETLLRRDIAEAGLSGDAHPRLILEPAIRSTAPAIAAAALTVAAMHRADGGGGLDTLMFVAPSDHRVVRPDRLRAAIAAAAPFARSGAIALFGITPTAPETGFGYIRTGAAGSDPRAEDPVRPVSAFVEKPDATTAAAMVADGEHLWNSGMFLFSARTILRELRAFAPDIVAEVQTALAQADLSDATTIRLGEAFAAAPALPIDTAVMERSSRLGVVPVSPGWHDLGTFGALWRVAERDAQDNAVRGEVVLSNVSGSYVRADSRRVAVHDLTDVCVVETADAVLVGPREASDSIKTLVGAIEQRYGSARDASNTMPQPDKANAGGVERTVLVSGAKGAADVIHLDIPPGIAIDMPSTPTAASWLVVGIEGRCTLVSADESTAIGAGSVETLAATRSARIVNDGPNGTRLLVVIVDAFQSGTWTRPNTGSNGPSALFTDLPIALPAQAPTHASGADRGL